MRKEVFLVFVMVLVLLCIPNFSFAGVANTEHDMFSEGKGTNTNICSYCHIPHNAAGNKIWSDWGNEAQLTSGPSSTIGNMCYTCHDGTASLVGQTTAFNSSLQQHKVTSGLDCDMCHSVHDNANGMFINIAKKEDSYCAACHDGLVDAGGLGDMTGVGNHQSYWTSAASHSTGASCSACHYSGPYNQAGTCNLCHVKAHGAANYSKGSITNPILRYDNSDSAFCATCHPVNTQASIGGNKHPANLSSAGTWGKVDCEGCHDPHQPGVADHPFILNDTNTDSQMCVNCHDGAQGPDIGNSHPAPFAFGSIIPLDGSAATGTPPGNVIDDDGRNGPDYPLNSGDLICESCHGIHRKVDAAGTKLLRITNTNADLCSNCHTDK